MAEPRIGPLTRERRRELTRAALIEAATDLFARQGFHATSLEEIASAAGFTRGAIYKNFRSKEDIILAVVDRHIELQLAAYADALEEMPVTERVTAAAEVWSMFFRRDPQLVLLELELRLHALREPEFRRRLAEQERRQLERVTRFISDQARAAGLRITVPPSDLAALSLAAVEGLSLAAAVRTEEAERYDGLVKTFFGMVAEYCVETEPKRRSPRAK